jgi:hypothetical protein
VAKQPSKPEPKSFKERIDPHGETEQMARFFGSPVGRLLGRFAGVSASDVDELISQYEQLTSSPDRVAAALGPLGWVFIESCPMEEYVAAATLAEQGTVEEAEQLLVDFWNNDPKWQEWPIHRLVGLYGGEDERIAIRDERQRLLRQALEHHRRGEYAASIPITLAQIDGVFKDLTGKASREFFDPGNPELVDDETIAGHPSGLRALSKMMSRGLKESASTGSVFRHAILHGQELGYDTKKNSTKIWTALFAVIDAMKPRADRLNEKLKQEREARLAGSKEVDADGRRLDRRGFDTAKLLLYEVNGYQYGHYAQHGHYTSDPDDLYRSGWVKKKELSVELCTGDAGQEYWAWVQTPTGLVFGAANRGGAQGMWRYQREAAPSGGISSGEDWRDIAVGEQPPDW